MLKSSPSLSPNFPFSSILNQTFVQASKQRGENAHYIYTGLSLFSLFSTKREDYMRKDGKKGNFMIYNGKLTQNMELIFDYILLICIIYHFKTFLFMYCTYN